MTGSNQNRLPQINIPRCIINLSSIGKGRRGQPTLSFTIKTWYEEISLARRSWRSFIQCIFWYDRFRHVRRKCSCSWCSTRSQSCSWHSRSKTSRHTKERMRGKTRGAQKKNMKKVSGWLGWYGVVATIAAYILVSFLILPPTSLWYQSLNLTGALGVTIETYYRKDYQPFWLNLVWAIIALAAIVNVARTF